jgi:hypothetical protein
MRNPKTRDQPIAERIFPGQLPVNLPSLQGKLLAAYLISHQTITILSKMSKFPAVSVDTYSYQAGIKKR